jgi:hypothetical protein
MSSLRRVPFFAPAFSALLFVSPARAAPVERSGLALKPGQAITFSLAVAGGRVAVGPARLTKAGAAAPKDGEVTVAVVKHGLSPYADVTATERTSAPVDFVATGLIGDIKIDEIVVCGKLDAPATGRIASVSWRISLNRFAVRPSIGTASQTGEGDLGCQK